VETEATIRHLRLALAAFALAVAGGTAAFALILDESFHAALYRAVVTISLTGIDTVPHGIGGEVATIVLILTGMAIYGYLASVLVEVIARGVVTGAWAERRRRRTIDRMSDHFIICGYGRVGSRVAREFRRQGQEYVVVDLNPDALQRAREAGDLLVEGSGTEDENLEAAGLPRAKGLVVASDDDSDNLYITLSARNARPDLLIVARASDEDAAKKLRLAGADRIVEPYLAAGRVMANLVLKPQVTAFLDVITGATGDDFRFEEIEILRSCGQTGRTIGELRVHTRTGAYIVGLRKQGGVFDTTPGPGAVLDEGDVVVAVGTADELKAVEQIFAPREALAG
jgi:voltage-gated potassium channel